jgi:predicted enzyme related to lactoylglutathione lyase
MSKQSRFVWHDLNTNDVAKAQSFYGELFNWTYPERNDNGYVHIQAGTQMIGGMRKQEPNEGPPNWMGYVGVDDVAASVEKAKSLGAKVYMPATKIEKAGTFAVIADPTGGVVAPWRSERPDEAEPTGRPAPYTFCWDELLTTDVDKATSFYTSLFGWGVEKVDVGTGIYTLLKRTGVKDPTMGGRDKDAGGMFKSPAPHSFWVCYVAVPDCDATFAKAKKLGATVHMEPTDIPNVGRFANVADPQGASIAFLQGKP